MKNKKMPMDFWDPGTLILFFRAVLWIIIFFILLTSNEPFQLQLFSHLIKIQCVLDAILAVADVSLRCLKLGGLHISSMGVFLYVKAHLNITAVSQCSLQTLQIFHYFAEK